MADRTTVLHGELEIFKEYLVSKNFYIKPIKAKYEILRAEYNGKKSQSKYKSQKAPLILYERQSGGCGYTLQNYYNSVYATFLEFKQNWYKERLLMDGNEQVNYRFEQYKLEQKEYLEKWRKYDR